MKRVLALFLVLICMLSVVACDKATGSGEPVRDGDVSDISEIDKNVSSETEQTQQANVESISGTISHIDEDKICDLTEEEVKIIADIIGNGTWNTEGTADCANDCKLIIDERTYYYHSECGTFNDEKNNQNLPVTAEEKENIIETNYPAFTVPRGFKCRNNREINDTHTNLTTSIYCSKPSSITSPVESKRTELRALR